MRAFNQSTFVRVTADHLDLAAFALKWPCSGIGCYDYMSVIFDKRNEDLVDISGSSKFDGAAETALIEDLRTYAKKRGLLT